MNLFIPTLSEIKRMTLFKKYINLISCPTDFAIASGALTFINKENILCSHYVIDHTDETYYNRVATVTDSSTFRYISKMDKYYTGIRPAFHVDSLEEKYVIDRFAVNEDLEVIEYGYFPKTLIKANKKRDTGYEIMLSTSEYALNKPEYNNYKIYNDGNDYFIEYKNNTSLASVSGKTLFNGITYQFKLEPLRFWYDKNSGMLLSQEVILGGIPYRILEEDEEYKYDDYMESDICKALLVIEKNIKVATDLINKDKDKKKVKK